MLGEVISREPNEVLIKDDLKAYLAKLYANNDITAGETDSLFTIIHGLFNQQRLRDVIRHFIYFPDTSKKDEKIVCRYLQYYAATKLYQSITLYPLL